MSKYAEIISLQRRDPLISVSIFVRVLEKVERSIFQSARFEVLWNSGSEDEDEESSLESESWLLSAFFFSAFLAAEAELLFFLDDISLRAVPGC